MDTKKGSLMQNGPGWNRNTVAEYCEKWLLMQSVHIRATTLTDYTSKIQRHIIYACESIKAFNIVYHQPHLPLKEKCRCAGYHVACVQNLVNPL